MQNDDHVDDDASDALTQIYILSWPLDQISQKWSTSHQQSTYTGDISDVQDTTK